jgi:cholesterol transport system auxiliary component
MIERTLPKPGRLVAGALVLTLLTACGALERTGEPPPVFYALDGNAPTGLAPANAPVAASAPTLLISTPQAAPGFASWRIIYLRVAHRPEYFANNEWIDTPPRMLAPLLASALEGSGAFRAIVLAPSATAGELRLDVSIVRLQHEFFTSPSQIRLTLRAHLVDNKTRQVLAWREFDETLAAPQDSPYGGVVAANAALRKVLDALAAFTADAAAKLPAAPTQR